jgi:hypothetical protein
MLFEEEDPSLRRLLRIRRAHDVARERESNVRELLGVAEGVPLIVEVGADIAYLHEVAHVVEPEELGRHRREEGGVALFADRGHSPQKRAILVGVLEVVKSDERAVGLAAELVVLRDVDLLEELRSGDVRHVHREVFADFFLRRVE